MSEIVFDSSVWLEYFAGTEKGITISEIIISNSTIYTPAISLAEIKNKFIQERKDYKEWIKFILTRSKIISINEQISLLAGNKKKEWKLYMVDALIYAISQTLNAQLLTSDSHFKHLENVKVL